MTGPDDPDWTFPQVEAPGPASVQLPEEEAPAHDTGSDAWWRAQAEAQRRAAESEPVVAAAAPPPSEVPAAPPLVEPSVLVEAEPVVEPSPLDRDWLPADLAEPAAAAAVVPPDLPPPLPVAAAPVAPPPAAESAPFPPAPEPAAPPYVALTRPEVESERVGPARAVAGAFLALAGVALLIGALLFFGKDDSKGTPTVASPPSAAATHAASTAPSVTATPTTAVSSPPAVVVVPPRATSAPPAQAPIAPVGVLNNSRIKGLADRGAATFRAGGWPVPLTGNYSGGTIAQTTVYFGPGQQASAQRFAKQFAIPRVLPRFAGLPGSGLTVVLTRDFR